MTKLQKLKDKNKIAAMWLFTPSGSFLAEKAIVMVSLATLGLFTLVGLLT